MAATVQGCAWHGADPALLTQKADAALAHGDTARAMAFFDGVRAGHAPLEYYTRSGALYRSLGTIAGRVRSQRVLELGMRHYPEEPQMWLELGKTHDAQTFYGDAARDASGASSSSIRRIATHTITSVSMHFDDGNTFKRIRYTSPGPCRTSSTRLDAILETVMPPIGSRFRATPSATPHGRFRRAKCS